LDSQIIFGNEMNRTHHDVLFLEYQIFLFITNGCWCISDRTYL